MNFHALNVIADFDSKHLKCHKKLNIDNQKTYFTPFVAIIAQYKKNDTIYVIIISVLTNLNNMLKKSDIIKSMDEVFIIIEILNDKQYFLYDLENQTHQLKDDDEIKSNFSLIDIKNLDHQTYINLMNYLNQSYKEATQLWWQSKKICFHHIMNKHDCAFCKICQTEFGHFCPDSPDNMCYYFTESDGKILLNNGTKIDAPPNHQKNYETFDSCLFCQNPEERK